MEVADLPRWHGIADRVALVTGASRGIGQAIALALGGQGATVIGTATTAGGAEAITEQLQSKGIAGRGLTLPVPRKPRS